MNIGLIEMAKETITGVETYKERLKEKDKKLKLKSVNNINRYQNRRKKGLCGVCGKRKAIKGLTRCKFCKERDRKYQKQRKGNG